MKRYYRKLQELSKSLYVSLPKAWITKFNLEKHSTVAIDIRGDGSLIIHPNVKKEGSIEESITINATKSVARDIVKYSLLGINKIEIKSDKKIDPKIRRDINSFIDRLPNTEILEDSPQRIEIHTLDITTVPTLKLIKRQLFLTGTMFENVKNNQPKDLESNFLQVRRFYYILVTHVRKYLRTGIYISEDKSFDAVEAMDLRMFCQKIEKISEILRDMILNDKIKEFFLKVETYFNDVIDAFLQKDYEFAYNLWFRRDQLKKDAKNLINKLDYEDIDKIKDMVMIAHLCKDMAALI